MANLNQINTRIEAIKASERTTKKELGLVSREVLEYTTEHMDAQVINRLVAVLTPMNKKTAIQFFSAFTPFKWVAETGVFGAVKKKVKDQAIAAMQDFLATDGDIWSWAEDHLKVEKKEPNFLSNITKNITKALESHKGREEVMSAVLAGGLSVEDIMAVLDVMEEQKEAA